jgi:rhodanese-related sulfurtransferase
MNSIVKHLTLSRALALIAFALGFFALFLGNPASGATAKLDAKDLAVIVQNEVDHIAPVELADWIITGRADYRLLDLRTEKQYLEYHIPGSENVPITALDGSGLMRNEKIVLYSDGGIHSAQAWMLLRAKGYKGVYILRGGLEEWKDQILFPRLPATATSADLAAFERSVQVSKFFGGVPQTGSAATTEAPKLEMPKLQMPGPGGKAPVAAGGKKKKEGC